MTTSICGSSVVTLTFNFKYIFGISNKKVGVRWTEHARRSKLWSGYVNEAIENGEDVAKLELDEDDFPVTWSVRNTNDGQDGKLKL